MTKIDLYKAIEDADQADTEYRDQKKFRPIKLMPLWPHEVIRWVGLFCLFMALMFLVSSIIPYYLEEPADPAGQPAVILPDWYILWTYGLLKIAPAIFIGDTVLLDGKLMGIFLNVASVFVMLAIPFWDRDKKARRPVEAPVAAAVGVWLLVIFVLMSAFAADVVFYNISTSNPINIPFLWEGGTIGQALSAQFLPNLFSLIITPPTTLGVITWVFPVVAGLLIMLPLRWVQKRPGYETKLSRSYYKIR